MSTAFVGLDYIVDVMGEGGRPARCKAEAARREVVRHANQAAAYCRAPVSYTHLTLPTKRIV